MLLPSDLISKFVKITKDDKKDKTETTVYGTVIESNGTKYVRFDGAEESQLTPVVMTVDAEDGERVSVLLKDHIATVTGNITSPAVRTETVRVVVENVEADNVTVKETLTAQNAEIERIKADMIDAGTLTAIKAEIEDLDANKLSAKDAELQFANIDFTNIGEAAIEKLFSESGIIDDLVMSEGHVTGKLVGVTIIGDLIEGGTVKADKLVILGTDGLYYKLNTNGVTTTAEQTEYNSLNGKIITAKSITAEKVNVDDLVAFGATIGGFHLTKNSIYSGAKASVDNTTRGIYQDTDGQFAAGDASRFVKFYKDADGTYKLAISANSITFGDESKDLETGISDAAKTAKDFLEFDATNGLQVGNKKSGVWSGFRAQITAGAFNVLNAAGAVLASYGEKLIELGKNATDAVIKFCGGKGQIEYVTDEDDGTEYIQMSSDRVRVKSSKMSSLYSMYTDNTTRWEKSAVNVSPNKVELYASECVDPGAPDNIDSWQTTKATIESGNVTVDTPGSVRLNCEGLYVKQGKVISVERGSSGIWTYSKWSDGTVELWGTYYVYNQDCNVALGSMYRTLVFQPDDFPLAVYNPQLVASYETSGYGAILWATTTTSSAGPPSYYLLRPVSGTISFGKITFHVTGTWV